MYQIISRLTFFSRIRGNGFSSQSMPETLARTDTSDQEIEQNFRTLNIYQESFERAKTIENVKGPRERKSL